MPSDTATIKIRALEGVCSNVVLNSSESKSRVNHWKLNFLLIHHNCRPTLENTKYMAKNQSFKPSK